MKSPHFLALYTRSFLLVFKTSPKLLIFDAPNISEASYSSKLTKKPLMELDGLFSNLTLTINIELG